MSLAPSAPPMLQALPTGGALSGSISTLNLFGSYITTLGLFSLMLSSGPSTQTLPSGLPVCSPVDGSTTPQPPISNDPELGRQYF